MRLPLSSGNFTIAPPRVALCAAGEIWGGVEQCVLTLSRHLIAEGVDTVVLTLFEGALSARLERANVPVSVVGKGNRFDIGAVKNLAAAFRRHKANVIHTHGYKATVLGSVAASLTGTRVVRTEHGRLEPARGSELLKMRLNEGLERAATWLTVEAEVAVTKDVQRQSATSRAGLRKYVVYNGLDVPPSGSCAPSTHATSKSTWDLGIVGRLAEVKGHRYLFAAVQQLSHLRGLRLLVFGEGPIENELRRLADGEGLRGRVEFMGFRTDVRDQMSRLDALAIPSLHEGLPYTLLEGMYGQRAIVASNVGGLAEVLEDRRTALLVAPRNSVALAEAIERLYNDETTKQALGAEAYRVVSTRFLAKTMAERYIEIYREMLLPKDQVQA